jgi:hypothetical protein
MTKRDGFEGRRFISNALAERQERSATNALLRPSIGVLTAIVPPRLATGNFALSATTRVRLLPI